MRTEEEIDFDFEIFSIFYSIDRELEYVENTLEFLNQSLNSRFKKLEDDYNNSYHSLYLEDYKSNFYDNYPNKNLPTEIILKDLNYAQKEEYQIHNTISRYIIQSILVKQVSIIEKFLKRFYEKNKTILCIKEEKNFSDIKKTINAIKKITKINLKELNRNNWCQLRIMNELRNRFAHGSNEFTISKEILKDLKKEFGTNFISEIQNKGNKSLCKIENDFETLIKFNKNMRNYIKKIENEFKIISK